MSEVAEMGGRATRRARLVSLTRGWKCYRRGRSPVKWQPNFVDWQWSTVQESVGVLPRYPDAPSRSFDQREALDLGRLGCGEEVPVPLPHRLGGVAHHLVDHHWSIAA